MVQRPHREPIQNPIHEYLWGAEGQDDDAGDGWKVRSISLFFNLPISIIFFYPCSLTGIGEVVLLPLDALKIKRQVNPEAFRGRGVVRIFLEEGTTLYRGWGWTMARNAPGSFAVRVPIN